MVEVGQEARYDAVYEADMKRAHAGCVKHKNAACAAFVANAIALGAARMGMEHHAGALSPVHRLELPDQVQGRLVSKEVCPPGSRSNSASSPMPLHGS